MFIIGHRKAIVMCNSISRSGIIVSYSASLLRTPLHVGRAMKRFDRSGNKARSINVAEKENNSMFVGNA
jgi:hypothetical protein